MLMVPRLMAETSSGPSFLRPIMTITTFSWRGAADSSRRQAMSIARRPRVSCLARRLRGERPVRRLRVDERIDVEVRRDDVRPLVEDRVERVVVRDVEHRDRAPSGARIDVAAGAACLVARDPRPERLP